jgi:hypothetical protein
MTEKPKDGGRKPRFDEFTLSNIDHIRTAVSNIALPGWASWIPLALVHIREDVASGLAARTQEDVKP